jgi:lipopolysaccharide transport system ATP-binding protein
MVAAISLDKLSKCFKVYQLGEKADYLTLRESMIRAAGRLLFWRRRETQAAPRPLWALKDVSLDVEPGEVLGVIGRNGAGKSTLLKILARITKPTSGEARIHGRVGSLLEVGMGFHPELTGRENVFLNGSILGMSRQEIRRKFDEIVAFAEVERFLDTPVKRYSSGMYGRLAFAVAAHLEPEVLVIDEVLAVGDAEFQKKCLRKMDDVAHSGRTVLFVSHDMGAIQMVCKRAALLVQGQLQRIGPAREVVTEYLKVRDAVASTPLTDRTDRTGIGRFRFEKLEMFDAHGNPADFAICGEDFYFKMHISVPDEVNTPLDVLICIRDHRGYKLTELASYFTNESPATRGQVREVVCRLPRVPFLAGEYRIDLWCATSFDMHDWIQDAAVLRVEAGNYFGDDVARVLTAERHGSILIPQQWGERARQALESAH